MDMRMKRGQGSTEYLVLLAVVLIVALVAIALLGFFPQLSTPARISQSSAYWSGANPVSIVDYKVTGTTIELEVRNTENRWINIQQISFDGTDLLSSTYKISPGKSKIINATTIPAENCADGAGDVFDYETVIITYNTASFNSLKQTGATAFVGECS